MAKQKLQRHPLNDIKLLLGPTTPHFKAQKFERLTAHIGLIFLRHLRETCRYVLDGSGLLFVYFGMPEAQRELMGKRNYHQVPQGQWSACCIPKFDLDAFLEFRPPEQDQWVTDALEKVLLSVAKQVSADQQPIRDAAAFARRGNFTAKFSIAKFTCQNPAKDRVARVWSHVERGMIRWLLEIEDLAGLVTESHWIPESCYRLPNFSEAQLKARWDKQGLSLRNERGRALYVAPLSE